MKGGKRVKNDITILSGVTLYQEAPGSKFSKAPHASFLEGPGCAYPENF
jgi:hypothetical protein